jgi:hypothetical protein
MRQRQARRADAAGVADLPIDFGGKLSAATHTLATVVECFERAYGCTGRGRGVDEVGICEASARAPIA